VTSSRGAVPGPPAVELEVGGRRVRITRPDKVLYPAAGFTKRDLVEYLLAIAPALLPHLAGRAVTLVRFPDGVLAPGWFQANCPPGRPDWIPVAEQRGTRGQLLRYCRLEEPAALAWTAGTGALELHPFLAAAARPDAPLALVFDLDPSPPAALLDACELALRVREALADAGLLAAVKTSGGNGVHVIAPLDGTQSFALTQGFARHVAERLARETPERVAARLARAGREGKVLVDWRQNAPGLSMVAPYSLRATQLPRVSTPLAWREVEVAVRERDVRPLVFAPGEVLRRVAVHGELFAVALAASQRVPADAPRAGVSEPGSGAGR
jgi:bifunctional non-homologous end joining protein LigD